MGKRLRLLNLTLGLVAILIASALAKTWVTPLPSTSTSAPPNPSQDAPGLAFTLAVRPPLGEFDVLVEKNPFKQPPPRVVPPGQASPTPPPNPLPVLKGTILVDDERRAVLSDKGKSDIYRTGQEVAGGVVTEIKLDGIVFKRGEESVEIPLKAAIETVPPGRGQVATPPPPPPPPPASAVQSPSIPPYEKQMRKEEKKLEKEQRKLLKQHFKR